MKKYLYNLIVFKKMLINNLKDIFKKHKNGRSLICKNN